MYEFQLLKEIFDKVHSSGDDESSINTTEDLNDLYSKIKMPKED